MNWRGASTAFAMLACVAVNEHHDVGVGAAVEDRGVSIRSLL